MKITIDYNLIEKNLPSIFEKMRQKSLTKKTDLDIKDWDWHLDGAQKISAFSFNDIISGKNTQQPREPETVDEKVYNLFKSGNLIVQIIAKNKKITLTHPFPLFNDESFFIPQEVVDNFTPNKIKLIDGKPTVFIYIDNKDGPKIHECQVLGALRDEANNQDYVAISHNLIYLYKIQGNNLLAQKAFPSRYLELKDFDETKSILIEKIKFKPLGILKAQEMLSSHPQWIEDKQSIVNVILGKLSGNPGFAILGKAPTHATLTKIPDGLPIIYLNPTENIQINEIKKKFKIR